jgi:hypothetical protein
MYTYIQYHKKWTAGNSAMSKVIAMYSYRQNMMRKKSGLPAKLYLMMVTHTHVKLLKTN